MIKVTYEMQDKKMSNPEITTINIFPGRMMVRYNIPAKAQSTVNKMRADGKKGVLYSRGCMIQSFPKKTEEQILAIVKDDIKLGLYVAKEKTKKDFKIKNLEITKK